jgi:hypothetical protein
MASQLQSPGRLLACHRRGIQRRHWGGTVLGEEVADQLASSEDKKLAMLILSSVDLIERGNPEANGTMETLESCAQGIPRNGRGER